MVNSQLLKCSEVGHNEQTQLVNNMEINRRQFHGATSPSIWKILVCA